MFAGVNDIIMIKITYKEVAELINKSKPYTRLLMHRNKVSMRNLEQVIDFIIKYRK